MLVNRAQLILSKIVISAQSISSAPPVLEIHLTTLALLALTVPQELELLSLVSQDTTALVKELLQNKLSVLKATIALLDLLFITSVILEKSVKKVLLLNSLLPSLLAIVLREPSSTWINACLASLDLSVPPVLQRNIPSTLLLRVVTPAHLATTAPEELVKKLSAPSVLLASRIVESPWLIVILALRDLPRTYLDKRSALSVVVELKLTQTRVSVNARASSDPGKLQLILACVKKVT